MPRAAVPRRAGFPTVRLVAFLLVIATALPAGATLPPPPVRLAALFDRPSWHAVPVDLPLPPWVGVFRGVM